MKQQLISIVGTTATGKTDLALSLAAALLASKKTQRVHLISADSRQVYAELPLLSGADIPEHFTRTTNTDFSFPFFENTDKTIVLHGVSMLRATDEWSVALFRDFALRILSEAVQKNEACILVGGTGLYHAHVLQTDPALMVPPDPTWRKEAVTLSVDALKEVLARLSPEKMQNMNQSDSNNPRRLQRAIEVARRKPSALPKWQLATIAAFEHRYLGIRISSDELQARITQRVQKRLDQGVLKEVEAYNAQFGTRDLPSSSTLGLYELTQVLRGELSLEAAIEKWSLAEFQYAKRQHVWWNKQKNVYWIDPTASISEVLDSITE